MSDTWDSRRGRNALGLASAILVFALFPVAQLVAAESASGPQKLATVLADVAGSVAQE